MTDKLRAGEAAEWTSHGGIARGKVKKKLTSRTTIKGHQVPASSEDLESLPDADAGAQAAPRPQAQRRRSSNHAR